MTDPSAEKRAILDQWIHEHGNMVTRTAYYFVKDQMLAEDLAQEVFLRAYTHMENYRQEAKVATWLYRITVNACKDYVKSWKYRMHVTTQIVRRSTNEPSAESAVMDRLNRDEITQKVFALPMKYREVILLHYYEHLTTREIAEMLEEKESTVRSRIYRGLAKLKDGMREDVSSWSF